MKSFPLFALGFCLILQPVFAKATPLHKVAVIDVVIEGDLTDQSRVSTWPFRLESLTRHLREGLKEDGTYDVVDMSPAADVNEKNKIRQSIHLCPPCLKEIAETVGADRILAARVFRQSNLLMYLQLRVIEPISGDTLISRNYTFRGDNDLAWIKSAEFALDDLKSVPEESR
jgi:hypothetical protein